nr:C25 family cysteine peptidase [Clostridiales bacterium]
MRRLFIAVISIFMVLAAADTAVLDNSKVTGYRITGDTETYLDLNFNVGSINYSDISTEKGAFTSVTIDGGYLSRNEGAPALPTFRNLIAIPYGAEPEVEVLSYETKSYKLSELGITKKIAPAQPSYSKSTKPEDIKYIYNESAYLASKFNEAPIASVSKSGTMRGIGVGSVVIEPFRYNPVESELLVYNNVQVRINFLNADPQASKIAAESYSPYFESAYSQLINYKPLDTKADLMTYPVTYLIVANSNLNGNADLERFIDWKTEKGFKVVTNYVAASTTISTIDTWVENQWNTLSPKPSFLLVIGDHDGTYGVLSEVDPSLGSTGSVTRSDLLYQVIGATSSSNRIPSIYAGRMSVRSTAELTAQVDKTIWYEKEQFSSVLNPGQDFTYLTRPLGVAGVDSGYGASHGNPQITYGWMHYFTSANGMANADYYLYPDSDGSSVPGEIVSFMSAGSNFYNYTAHGAETVFADPSFTISNVDGLANAGEYPLVVGNCCLTGSFGTTECFGESWLNAANKGAVGFIGASMSTYWDEDLAMGVGLAATNQEPPPLDTANPGMYDGVMALGYSSQAATRHIGLMAVEALGSGYTDDYWCAYQMFGDPSVQIYFGIPSSMTASHDGVIAPGSTSFTVTTTPYAYVAMGDQNGVLHGAARANSSGVANVTISEYTVGDTGKLVITAQFKKPYFEDVLCTGDTGGTFSYTP